EARSSPGRSPAAVRGTARTSSRRARRGTWCLSRTDITETGRGRREGPRAGRGMRETRAMTKHSTGTREEWLAARLGLLGAEKEHTHRSDDLARRRQELLDH